MKQIIIFLLVIIVALVSYGQYSQYKRFNAETYEYTKNDSVDLNYHDQEFLFHYYEAVEDLNAYVITQWRANEIDVKAPEDASEITASAVNEYSKKLAKVKFYEARLIQSLSLKENGFSNTDIKRIEVTGASVSVIKKEAYNEKIKTLFLNSKAIRIGAEGALVFEIQKLLKSKGHDIPVDGMFKQITFEALKAFEAKHELFADGKLDLLTLEQLLE